jgi:DNA-binding HxlR family transcriptional regulator
MLIYLIIRLPTGEGAMSQQYQEPIVQVLHAIGNPIRKAAIEALSRGEMRFTQLLASCELDYDHDTGYFNYHLSELVNRRIVEKDGNAYRLTGFGQKIADMLSSLEKECSFLLVERTEGGERYMVSQDLETEWIDTKDFAYIEFKKEREEFKDKEAGVNAKIIAREKAHMTLEMPTIEGLPESPQRENITKFSEGVKSWKGSKTLLIKDKGIIIGWAIMRDWISWVGRMNDALSGKKEERQELELYPRAFLIIEDIGVQAWVEDRKGVALSLLKALLEKASQLGADIIELMRIDVNDAEVIEAFSDMGFERIATTHTMKKRLL